MKKKNILITGGAGYIGTELCNFLSQKNNIYCLDTFWFGHGLKKKIKKINHDVRNYSNKKLIRKIDIIIHLAAIANDPSVELNPKLSWEVNVLGTLNMLNLAEKCRVKKFIFASSGSVYGIKKEIKVHENLNLEPISEYNKTKMIAERIVLSFSKKIKTVIIRPATVCGISKNPRFDLTVNTLTKDALLKKKINILGGMQYRPNLHMKDMINIYDFFIKKNLTGIFNAGFENFSINQIAKKIIKTLPKTKFVIKKSNDVRSYRIDSSKLLKAGFKPKYSVNNAIQELKQEINKKFIDKKNYYRVSWLKKILKNKHNNL